MRKQMLVFLVVLAVAYAMRIEVGWHFRFRELYEHLYSFIMSYIYFYHSFKCIVNIRLTVLAIKNPYNYPYRWKWMVLQPWRRARKGASSSSPVLMAGNTSFFYILISLLTWSKSFDLKTFVTYKSSYREESMPDFFSFYSLYNIYNTPGVDRDRNNGPGRDRAGIALIPAGTGPGPGQKKYPGRDRDKRYPGRDRDFFQHSKFLPVGTRM